MFIDLLLKSTDLSKQDCPKCSCRRATILGKSVRFILFFHILGILRFLGKLKKDEVRIFVVCVTAFISCIPRNHTVVFLIKYQITCCYRKIAFLLKYYDNPNINKATFHIFEDSLKSSSVNFLFIFLENNF